METASPARNHRTVSLDLVTMSSQDGGNDEEMQEETQEEDTSNNNWQSPPRSDVEYEMPLVRD